MFSLQRRRDVFGSLARIGRGDTRLEFIELDWERKSGWTRREGGRGLSVGGRAISVAIASVLAKKATFPVYHSRGKRLQSQVLVKPALASQVRRVRVGAALVGVIGAICRYPIMDKLAALFVCALLARLGLKLDGKR